VVSGEGIGVRLTKISAVARTNGDGSAGIHMDRAKALGSRERRRKPQKYQGLFESRPRPTRLSAGGQGNDPTFTCIPAGIAGRAMTVLFPMDNHHHAGTQPTSSSEYGQSGSAASMTEDGGGRRPNRAGLGLCYIDRSVLSMADCKWALQHARGRGTSGSRGSALLRRERHFRCTGQ